MSHLFMDIACILTCEVYVNGRHIDRHVTIIAWAALLQVHI